MAMSLIYGLEKTIAQAETDLDNMTLCLGMLARIKHMYDDRGIMTEELCITVFY